MRSVDDLTMYAYGLLEGPQEASMRDHVRACAACAEMTRRLGAEHRLLETALSREIPDSSTRARATDQVLARKYAPRRAVDLQKVLSRVRAAAGIAFVISLSLLLLVSAGLRGPAGERLIASPPAAMMAAAEPGPPLEVRQPPAPAPGSPVGAACDLKIVMTWDGRASVDLEVQEPGGGHGSMDHRNRYGLETYVVPRVGPGTYRVGAQLRGEVRSPVKFLVVLFEGTAAEERHEQSFVLERPGELKFIRDIHISR